MGRPAQLFVQSCKFQKDQNAYFILVFPKILIIVNSAAGLQIQRYDVHGLTKKLLKIPRCQLHSGSIP